LLSVNTARRITIWSLEDDHPKKLKDLNSPSTIMSIAWHHESGEIAAGCEDHAIRVWDIQTGRVGTIDGHTREVISLAYSPTSDLLVSYSWDGTTRLWNSRTGDLLLRSQQGWARAFSRDGKKLSYVKPNKGFGYWNVVEPEVFSIFGYPLRGDSWMRWVDFSPDATLLAVGYYSGVQVWDVAARTLVAEIPGRDIKTIAFTSGDSLLISDVKGAREWRLDRKNGKVEPTEVARPIFDKWKDKSVVLSIDRRTAAVASRPSWASGPARNGYRRASRATACPALAWAAGRPQCRALRPRRRRPARARPPARTACPHCARRPAPEPAAEAVRRRSRARVGSIGRTELPGRPRQWCHRAPGSACRNSGKR
jgi:hypothetical protein